MGFPIIKVSSVAGGASDTNCSGAGPATSITGLAARQRAGITNPLRIGLFGFTGSLAGVAADGTHTILFNDTTAGYRSHASIAAVRDVRDTGLANMTATSVALTLDGSPAAAFAVGDVIKITGAAAAGADLYTTIAVVYTDVSYDVFDAAGTTVSLATYECPKAVGITSGETGIVVTADTAWAIGGVRASLTGTLSRKLFVNNSAAGDWKPGWIVEMQSGHAETFAAELTIRQGGDVTNGRVAITGAEGAAVRPKLTFTHATQNCIAAAGSTATRILCDNFDIERNVTGTAAGTAVYMGGAVAGAYYSFRRLKITSVGTSNWAYGCYGSNNSLGDAVSECYIEKCTTAILGSQATGNYIVNCGTGINITNRNEPLVMWNVIVNPATTGIFIGTASNAKLILHNVIFANTGTPNGISISSTTFAGSLISNNVCSGLATAIEITGTVNTATLASQDNRFRNNCIYNCTTQITSGYESLLEGTVTTDPTFTNAAGGDFSVGTNMKAAGWPNTNIGFSNTRSYVDIGPQRQEPAGGGGVIIIED